LYIFSAAFDPLLDDATRFLQRLDAIQKPYKFMVFELPHGWLNFANAMKRANRALTRATQEIKKYFPVVSPLDHVTAEPASSQSSVESAPAPASLLSRMTALAMSPLSLWRTAETDDHANVQTPPTD
jgi:hypothetical protein